MWLTKCALLLLPKLYYFCFHWTFVRFTPSSCSGIESTCTWTFSIVFICRCAREETNVILLNTHSFGSWGNGHDLIYKRYVCSVWVGRLEFTYALYSLIHRWYMRLACAHLIFFFYWEELNKFFSCSFCSSTMTTVICDNRRTHR